MMLFVVGIECGHTFDYTTRECCKLSAMTVAVSVLTRVFDIICRTHKLTHVVFWIPRSVPYLTVSLALSICNMDNTALPKYFAINNTVHIHVNANATNISCTEHCYHPIVTTINNPPSILRDVSDETTSYKSSEFLWFRLRIVFDLVNNMFVGYLFL